MLSFDSPIEVSSVGQGSVHFPQLFQYKLDPSTDVAHQKYSKPPFMQVLYDLSLYLNGKTHGYFVIASHPSAELPFDSLIKVGFFSSSQYCFN